MAGLSILEKYKELLATFVRKRLLQRARSRRKVRNRHTAVSGYPAAYLALNPLDGFAEFVGSKPLLSYAKRCGDFFYDDWVGRNRTTLPNEHFSTTFFVDLYGVMAQHLDSAHRRRWADCLRSHCDALSTALKRKLSAKRKRHSALEVGCGPNHLYCWAAMLYKGGVVLKNAAYRRRSAWAIHKLLEAYDENGYHAEHVGPVLQYHVVTMGGLSTYYRLSGDDVCLEPLRRGADFWCRTIYPDLSPIEVFDERNRRSPNYAITAHGALQLTPTGRRYIDLSLDRMLAGEPPRKTTRHRRRRGWHVGWVLRHILHYEDAPTKPLPVESDRMLVRLDHAGLVRRTGPWLHALSAFCNEPWETNPFILDRVQNLSVWHENAGLIIGGGNDKHAPEVATIYALEGGFVGYYRPRSGSIVTGRDGDQVALDYGPITATLRVKESSPKKLKLTATLDHWVLNLEPRLNLQLQLRAGSTIGLGTGRNARLTRSVDKVRTIPTGGEIRTKGWTLKGPKDMTLKWPHMPYNSYRVERHTDIEAAVGIATVPFAPEGGRLQLELRIL